jgi:tRNA pseudouridine55 synthase
VSLGDDVTASGSAVNPSGLVLVDKEAGPSSFAIVKRVGAGLGAKAGHAGTLDPFATGLLLVLIGRATRLARYLVGLDKRYSVEITLGVRTSTGDPEGEVVEETAIPAIEEIEALRGEVELSVPRASAVKVGGERAYRLHRRGDAVEMPRRRSTIHELVVRRFEGARLELDLAVSSGTYVRAIADALGGHCASLRRTAVGGFRVEDANEASVLPAFVAVAFLPGRSLEREEAARVRTGRPVDAADAGDGAVALLEGGNLVAVGRSSSGMIWPETVLG